MLQRAVGYSAAVAMLLGGEVVSGREAERIGLVHRCVPDDELLAAAKEFSRAAAAGPGELVARIKASLGATRDGGYAPALEHELAEQLWSVRQPAFAKNLAALRDKIASKPT